MALKKKTAKKSSPAKATKPKQSPTKKAPVSKTKADSSGGFDKTAWAKATAAAAKAWNKKRGKPTAGIGEANANVEDGTYVAKVSGMRLGVDKNGKPYMSFTYVITRGDAKGEQLSSYHSLDPANEKSDKIQQAVNHLENIGVDTSELDLSTDLPGLMKEINTAQPAVRLNVKTNAGYQNVFVREALEDEEADEEESEYDDGEEEEETEEEEIEEEEEEEEEE